MRVDPPHKQRILTKLRTEVNVISPTSSTGGHEGRVSPTKPSTFLSADEESAVRTNFLREITGMPTKMPVNEMDQGG